MSNAVARIILLVVSSSGCQYQDLAMAVAPPKEVTLQMGCLAKYKTIQPITDQLGTVVYAENVAFISLPTPNTNQPNYLPCNLPTGLRNGQKVHFSAQVMDQPEIVNGAVVDYWGQAIELSRLTLL